MLFAVSAPLPRITPAPVSATSPAVAVSPTLVVPVTAPAMLMIGAFRLTVAALTVFAISDAAAESSSVNPVLADPATDATLFSTFASVTDPPVLFAVSAPLPRITPAPLSATSPAVAVSPTLVVPVIAPATLITGAFRLTVAALTVFAVSDAAAESSSVNPLVAEPVTDATLFSTFASVTDPPLLFAVNAPFPRITPAPLSATSPAVAVSPTLVVPVIAPGMLMLGAVSATAAAVTPFTVSAAAPASSSVKLWPAALNGDAALTPNAPMLFAPIRLTGPTI